MVHASLFSGIGGFDLAAEWMGWENAFHCEINEWCAKVLKYHFPNSIHYADITKTDFTEWRGRVDIITGGFPCQPFSLAGQRKGADDDRYLWPEMLRVIWEVRPAWVVGENVGGIITMVQPGEEIEVEYQSSLFEEDNKETVLTQDSVIETICRDLESEGYSVQPILIPACSVGAPHRRDRVWFIANSNRYDARRRQFRETGCETGKMQSQQEKWERLRDDVERNDAQEIVANTNSEKLQEWFKAGGRENKKKVRTGLDNGIERFSNLQYASNSNQFNGNISRFHSSGIPQLKTTGIQKDNWQDFPTQSPICCRNDGISLGLDGSSFSKWRTESIKSYGNAIVPQVAYEIFKAIELVNNQSE